MREIGEALRMFRMQLGSAAVVVRPLEPDVDP